MADPKPLYATDYSPEQVGRGIRDAFAEVTGRLAVLEGPVLV